MILKKFLIAGGNSTLIAWNCPKRQKSKIIKKYLGEVEQIGFAEKSNNITTLKMMGGELCINSTLALASEIGKQGILLTSGVKEPVVFENKLGITSIKIPLNFRREENIVLFEGIGFICSEKPIPFTQELLTDLVKRYSLPAFGVLIRGKNKIRPFVYVKSTDSLFEETACGSGSIACSILTGYSKIIQPTGKSIAIRQKGNLFIVSAKVVKIGESYD